MDTRAILARYDDQERANGRAIDAEREDTGSVVRFSAGPTRNAFIVYARLVGASLDDVIDEQVAHFQGRALALAWKVFSHDERGDLSERLLAHGFQADEQEAIMALELDQLNERLRATPGGDIRKKSTGDSFEDVISILNGAFGSDHSKAVGLIQNELRQAPDQISVYVAYVDGQPASCGWVRFPDTQFASLWAGSTLEAYRGQGLYTTLVAVRAQEARARGYCFLTIDAGPMSQPIVARHGFQVLTTAADYVYTY